MKAGDEIKIKVDRGYWMKGHEGRIMGELFLGNGPDGKTKTYDFAVQLDGDFYWSGFDKDELEKIK